MLSAKVSVIDWRENQDSDLVVYEDDQILDQKDEIQFEQIQLQQKQVLIVGLGSGFILETILAKNPEAQITVIDCRDALISQQIRKYPQVQFEYFYNMSEFESHPDINQWMRPEFQKILNKRSLGSQSHFLQELFWFLNVRTTSAVKKIATLKKPLDDRWLVNLQQFVDHVDIHQLPYSAAESLILRELVK